MRLILLLLLLGCDSSFSLPQTWYLNFDSGKYPAYSSPYGTDDRDEVVSDLKSVFYAYNINIVLTRPSYPHNEVIFSGVPEMVGQEVGVVGLSDLDCGDTERSNTVLVFTQRVADWWGNDIDKRSEYLWTVSVIAAHEIGHSLGLEHTDNKYDLMYPDLSPANQFSLGYVIKPDVCKTGPIQNSPELLEDLLGTVIPSSLPGKRIPLDPKFPFRCSVGVAKLIGKEDSNFD